MLCYFPFTYMSDELIGPLTRSLGPLAVYQGLESSVPDHMRRWAAQSQLDMRFPAGVDQSRLQQALADFRAWADLHQGSLADLAAFLRAGAKGAPLVDETDPTQISTQIRSHGQEPLVADPLFQACLFLVIAQDYDTHQEALSRELATVERMEQHMLSHLAGTPHEEAQELGARLTPGQTPAIQEAGLYMIDERIQAWALLAGCDVGTPWAYVTTSRAGLEAMLDRLPQARKILQWSQETEDPTGAEGAAVAMRRELLRKLAFSEDPWAVPVSSPVPLDGSAEGPGIAFYCLPGCSPRRALALLHRQTGFDQSHALENSEPNNTLIGIMDCRLPG